MIDEEPIAWFSKKEGDRVRHIPITKPAQRIRVEPLVQKIKSRSRPWTGKVVTVPEVSTPRSPWTFEMNGVKLARGFKGYVTPQKEYAPSLHPAKRLQREQIANLAPKGTILELYAGRGNLSKTVYAKRAKKLVLVDMDKDALRNARRKLGDKPHETYPMENTEFIEKHLSNGLGPELEKKLVLVDFDAFGSPTDAMRSFFSKYRVRRPLYVTATDGAFLFLKRHSGQEYGRDWVRRHYGVNRYPTTREGHVATFDRFVDNLGEKHGFKAQRLSPHASVTITSCQPSRPPSLTRELVASGSPPS